MIKLKALRMSLAALGFSVGAMLSLALGWLDLSHMVVLYFGLVFGFATREMYG